MNNDLKVNDYPNIVFAGFWLRFFAFMIDILTIWCISQIIKLPLYFIGIGNKIISIWYINIGLYPVILTIYFVFFTKLTNGQTLGKIILGLRVVCFGEKKISWETVIIREVFGRYTQNSLIILYLLAAFMPKKQHFIDILTDTSVISETYLNLYNTSEFTHHVLSDS